MSSLHTFSLLFFAAFSICLFLGLYIFFLDMKNTKNQAFFAVCLSLSVWSFSFSMANASIDYETALAWRRVASVGWGTIFSILLHFAILFTGLAIMQKKQRWLLYLLLYLPSCIVVYVFGIQPELASNQYDLVHNGMGWMNIPINNGWDWFYNIYYISYTAAACALLIWKYHGTTDRKVRRQYNAILYSFLTAMVTGTVTEMILNRYTSFHMPQIGPLLALMPVGTVFYLVRKYHFLLPEKTNGNEMGRILSETNRKLIYHIISMVVFIGSMLNFVVQFYFSKDPGPMMAFYSIFLFAVGLAFQLISRIHVTEKTREIIFIVVVSIAIPVMTLRFLKWGSMTIWAAPMIFVVMSVVFNKKWFLAGLTSAIICTQLVVWLNKPRVVVEINTADYLVRLAIFSLAIWVAHVVNNIYIQRLRENEEQVVFQKMVSQISAEFIGINELDLDEKIRIFLRMTGEHFQADRALFISMVKEQRHAEWFKEGCRTALNSIPDMSGKEMEWWKKLSGNDEVICIQDIDTLTDPAEKEKEVLNLFQIKSLVVVPIFRKEQAIGFVFLGSMQETRICTELQKDLLKILAHILTNGLVKVEAQREINYMAYYDPLTGVANRSLFLDRLEQAVNLAKRNETIIGVIFIDLDSFKSVNDSIGHAGGNELLKKVAERLSACLRKNDTVARFGGDEFVIQVNHIKEVEDVKFIAEKVIRVLANPFLVGEQEFFVTASIGISLYPYDGDNGEELVKNADLAMYTSKDNGKHQYTLCSAELKEDVLRKTKLTNRLYRAIDHNELELYYQPQVNAQTKKIIGFEALLRWNNKEFGWIPPSAFIPLAEQSGLILSIGAWVLETACRQNKLWQDTGLIELPVAVNLSPEQFRDRKLVAMVERILKETSLDPKYLELEITERTAIEQVNSTMDTLVALKHLGVAISIDDFGIEYSSLNRLKVLPIDQLKIDIQFIRHLHESKKDKAIVKTIIQLARNLELQVIAEGVENEEQYEFLKAEQCDEIQGYYFYKPMPARELEKLLVESGRTMES